MKARLSLETSFPCVASVSKFLETEINQYRRELAKCWTEAVGCLNQNLTNQHYECDLVHDVFNNADGTSTVGVNWMQLMVHHDLVASKSCQTDNSNYHPQSEKRQEKVSNNPLSSALQELLNVLAFNPTVIPAALSLQTVLLLIRVLVETPIDRPRRGTGKHWLQAWTDSQSLILRGIDHLLCTRPSCSLYLGPLLMEYTTVVLATASDNKTALGSCDADRLYRMVSFLKQLVTNTRRNHHLGLGVLKCFMLMIKWLDHVDVTLLLNERLDKTQHETNSAVPLLGSAKPGKSLPRVLSSHTLTELHNNDRGGELPSGMIVSSGSGTGVEFISTKSNVHSSLGGKSLSYLLRTLPLTENSHGSTQPAYNRAQSTASNRRSAHITKLPYPFVLLRSRLYKAAVTVFATLSTQIDDTTLTENGGSLSDRSSLLIRSTTEFTIEIATSELDACSCEYSCASLLLCCVLFANVTGQKGHQELIETIWKCFEKAQRANSQSTSEADSRKSECLLRMFSELLDVCSAFDDASSCWKAVLPLVEYVLNSHDDWQPRCGYPVEHAETMACNGAKATLKSTYHRSILRCISHILSRRGSLLSDLDEYDLVQYNTFIAQLSLRFSSSHFWVSHGISIDEKQDILYTLQRAGILSSFESINIANESSNESSSAVESESALSNHGIFCMKWEFQEPKSLRSAFERMGPEVNWEELLSSGTIGTQEEAPKSKECAARTFDDERQTSVPLMHYIHDDLLFEVFSFLGYKRLVRSSAVSKKWNTISKQSSLWRRQYQLRYEIRSDDTDVDSYDWRHLFRNKWLAEKAIRFQHSSSGWRHRTCPYIGCLKTLKTAGHFSRHCRLHVTTSRVRKKKDELSQIQNIDQNSDKESSENTSLSRKRLMEARKKNTRGRTKRNKRITRSNETVSSADIGFMKYLLNNHASKNSRRPSTILAHASDEDEAFARYMLEKLFHHGK